jgi:type I restriction enzyme S subunit
MSEAVNSELPDNWVMTTLGNITQPIEKVKPADEPQKEILYLDIGGIDKATNTVIDYKKYLGKDAPSRAQQEIKKGDIAFANVRPYLRNIAIVPNDLDGQVGSTGFCFLRPAEGVDNKYIYYWVLSNTFINDINKYQKGSSYPAVTNKQILERNIPLAPPEQQRRIVIKIEELFSHIDAGIEALKKAKQILKQYRQTILKAAVTGELTREWREANKDKLEPASQLLDRILKERRQKWEEQQL